jgi:hypothetical protein
MTNSNSTRTAKSTERTSIRNLSLRIDTQHAQSQSLAAARRMARLLGTLRAGKVAK